MKQPIKVIQSIIVLFFFAISAFVTMHAQDVVINEYKNIVSIPQGEGTELLIIKDKMDLVGFVLRDNSAAGAWQGGVKFKDVPLWKNLRAGTVIYVFHRGVPTNLDLSAADGSIILSAENTTHFEPVLFGSTSWSTDALNIAQTSDMVQLLDATGNPHHTLGHGNATYRSTYFDMITGAKLFHEGSIANGLIVYPGATLADYSMPNTGNAKTVDPFNESPSYPNYNSLIPFGQKTNSDFWHSLRQPSWNSPTVSATLSQAGAKLTWNAMNDNYPADNYQGYIIMRGSATAKDTVPQDGREYNPGNKIGDWEVVTNVIGSQTLTYQDIFNLPCGEAVKYRIFPFRYGIPDIDSIVIASHYWYAKGRNYNETSFGTYTALREAPAIPTIAANGKTTICEGTAVLLKMQGAQISGMGYEWYKDGAPITGARSPEYSVMAAGTYKLRIIGLNGCANESAPITITILPKPTATVFPTKTIRICTGDSTVLQAGPAGLTFTWLLNGAVVANNQPMFNAMQAGNYQVIAKDEKGCIDTSDITSIVFRSIVLQFPDPNINFGTLDGCKSSVSQSSMIRNTGADTAIINAVDVPAGFQFTAPSLPLVIPPGKTATLTFTFAPTSAGTITGNATVKTSTCAAIATIALKGIKEQASVTQSYSTADFGRALSCQLAPKDTTLTIENKGTSALSITKAQILAPFSIVNPTNFPLIIPGKGSSQITVRYTPTNTGSFNEVLTLPYTSGSCLDTLKVAFKGEIVQPAFAIADSTLSMQNLFGCTMYGDTVLTLSNTGQTTLTLTPQTSPGITILSSVPVSLKSGEDAQVQIRVQPPSDGLYSGTISFIANECGLKKDIAISLTKSSANYQLSSNAAVFKNFTRCDKSEFPKDSIVLTANALGISGEATIGSITVGNIFRTALKKGDSFSNGSLSIPIYFEPIADGIFNDSLTITFEPCSITKTIALSGSMRLSEFSIAESLLAFSVIDSGKTEQKTFTFTNTGAAPVTINSISGIDAPFSYTASQDLSKQIDPGATVVFTVTFAPLGKSDDSVTAVISVGGNCPKTITLALTGKGNLPKPLDVNGTAELFSSDASVAPGKQVVFPYRLVSSNIDALKIDSMSFDIAYNPTLLLPTSIKPKQQGITALFKESVAGILHIQLGSTDTNHMIAGNDLFDLECTALLGDAMSTRLTASNQQFSKRTPGTFSFTVYNPLFQLTDICNLKDRLMKVDGQFSLALQKEGLVFSIVSQDYSSLELYSTIGEKLYTLREGNLATGEHLASLPEDLPSGMYIAILRSGRFMLSLPFGFLR